MKLAIGSDHAGWESKEKLKTWLQQNGHEIYDYGTTSQTSCDYPDYAIQVSNQVANHSVERGILICGTGIGMAITSNKIPGIRAAVCLNEEMAKLSREHNDCNVLCLGSRFTPIVAIQNITQVWLNTPFEGGRHQRRVDKICELEHTTKI